MKKISGIIILSMSLGACGVSVDGTGSGSPDAYEEDDIYLQAKSISVGTSQNHNFVDDDSDWLAFSAVAGYTYTIETSNLGFNEDTELTLYSDSLYFQTYNDDTYGSYASKIIWTASSSGNYFINVGSWGNPFSTSGREYRISLTSAAPAPTADLSMGSMTVPASVAANDVISLTDSVNNIGTAAAGNFVVDYYISSNTTISTADIYLGSRSISSLATGATNTSTSDFAVPGSLTPGLTYYVGAIVDGGYTVSELNESNNISSAYAINITAAQPSDLSISGLSAASSVNAGESLSVVDTVSNSVARSNGIVVNYYLSTDAVVDGTDTYLGTRSITMLDAGASDTGSGVNISFPRDLATGTYYFGAIVDPSNLILETDDTNNNSNVLTLTVGAAVPSDLNFSAFSPATTVGYYAPISITDTVTNQGSGNEGSFIVKYYLSTDAVVDVTDSYLGSRTIGSLAAGASDTATSSFTQYNSVGTYYVAGLIDVAGSAIESDISNNTSSVVTVTLAYPDIAMGAVSVPATATVGSFASVTDIVTNVGSVDSNSFYVDYYLSTDNVVTTADTYLGGRYINSLAMGASNNNSGSISIPSTLANGDYYIAAIADPYNYLSDLDSSNNTSTPQLITISGACSPDAYEEDDTYTAAKAIGVAQSQNHNFCTDATDWLSFSATIGTSYTMTTSALGNNADTTLSLKDTDGITELSYNDDYSGLASQIVWTAPATGTYYINVGSYSGSTGNLKDYTITLTSP